MTMVRMLFILGVFLALSVLIGCNRSEPGGGAAAGGKSFKLKGPYTATTVKQGESRKVQVEVSRDKGFDEDINLSAEAPAGSGLTVRFADAVLKGTATYADLDVTAAEDAQVGKHKVRVVGTPTQGNATDLLVDIDVKAAPARSR